MKKILSLSVLFMAAFLFVSCDDLSTVEIPFGITTTHDLTVNGNDSSIDTTLSIDLTTNADFNKHKNDIKDVGIDSVQIMITEQVGPQTLTGSVTVDALTGSSPTVLAALSNDLLALQTETATAWKTIPTTEPGRTRLADLIKNDPHSAKLALTGTATNTPVHFQAHFKIFWAMKATEELL